MSENRVVPFHVPSIGEEELAEVVATIRSGWLTTGPRTTQFEREFQNYVGSPHALAVNSCTAGLHLSLVALGIGPSDEVITTPLTFCSTINSILHVGATPVLADVGPDGNIDLSSIAQLITEKTRAIMPVHLAGLPCFMDEIWSLARERGIFVIEDAAHAVGSQYKQFPIGTGNPETGARSDAVAYSLYATKNLTTGEGGMVTTHSGILAARMRTLCLHGMTKDAWNRYSDRGHWYYEVLVPGFKYNLSDIQAAIGIHQLRRLDQLIEVRTRYAHLYHRTFADMMEVEPPPDRSCCRHSWHLYMLRLNLEKLNITREQFIAGLRRKNIFASMPFIPIALHPFFAPYASSPQNHCPRALALYPRLVSLPLYPAMSEQQVERVARSIKEIVWASKKQKRVEVANA